jgi:hypothetical protein
LIPWESTDFGVFNFQSDPSSIDRKIKLPFYINVKYYVVEWRGPFTYGEVIADQGWEDDEELYAIAHEPPTRENRTLYVGRASRQYIGKRLDYHNAAYNIHEKYGGRSIRYYLGRVRFREGKRWSEKRVRDIENAIIFQHGEQLQFNIQSTASYSGRSLSVTQIGVVPPGIVSFSIQ